MYMEMKCYESLVNTREANLHPAKKSLQKRTAKKTKTVKKYSRDPLTAVNFLVQEFWQLSRLNTLNSQEESRTFAHRTFAHQTLAHSDNCSLGQLLTLLSAHPDICSPGTLLTRIFAHPVICSPGHLLTRKITHPDFCSPLFSFIHDWLNT